MATQKKNPRFHPWHVAMSVCAFASMISFIHSGSYKAEKSGTITEWVIAGIVLALGAIFCLWKTKKTSSGQGG